MNYDEVMALSDEQLVEAVYKQLGWEWVREPDEDNVMPVLRNKKLGKTRFTEIDYLHSLDDCFVLLKGYTQVTIHVNPIGGNVEIYQGASEYYAAGDTINVAILRAYLLSRGEK